MALLAAGGVAASASTLRRWPLGQSIGFLSPSAGPVVIGRERIFVGGAVHACREPHFARDPSGRGVRFVRS